MDRGMSSADYCIQQLLFWWLLNTLTVWLRILDHLFCRRMGRGWLKGPLTAWIGIYAAVINQNAIKKRKRCGAETPELSVHWDRCSSLYQDIRYAKDKHEGSRTSSTDLTDDKIALFNIHQDIKVSIIKKKKITRFCPYFKFSVIKKYNHWTAKNI